MSLTSLKHVHVDLVCASAEEVGRVEENKKELDRYLGVYPYKRCVQYRLCTSD